MARPDAVIAFYVWDYPGGGFGFIDSFWKAAIVQDPEAVSLDESTRLPFCKADQLQDEVASAGYLEVEAAMELSPSPLAPGP